MKNSIHVQLLLSHMLLVLLLLAVMAGAIVHFTLLGGSIGRILKDNYLSVRAAQTMKEALERQDSAASFVLGGEYGLGQAQFETNSRVFEEAFSAEAHNITEPGEQQLVTAIRAEYARYHTQLTDFLYAKPQLTKVQAHDRYFGILKPGFEKVKAQAQDILELNQRAIQTARDRAESQARNATATSIAVTLAAVLIATVFSLRTVRSAMSPLRSLARQAEEIGAGHWNHRIDLQRSDEIGMLADSFNRMAVSLGEAWQEEEERLRRAERMSDAALENLYDPVVVTDSEGKIVHWNRAASGLFGARDEAVGTPISEAIHDRRIVEAVERAITREHVFAAEGEAGFVLLERGDAQRTYRLRATPMRDNSTLLGAVVVLEDITHLRELDRLKSEFIGVASHELRTPVTSLLLSVQLMQEGAAGELSEVQQEVVAAQRHDLERLDRMMRDLLDLMRLEQGVTPPRFELVSPTKLLATAVQAVQGVADQKGVEIRLEPGADAPAVRADTGQMHRVITNLLNNAIRFSPAGREVLLGAHREGDYAVFAVRDQGPGIPPEYLTRIFERFVQVPGSTEGGSGIGLSIAQNIVKSHGGDIHVESEPGKGSTFIFRIPLADAAEPAVGQRGGS